MDNIVLTDDKKDIASIGGIWYEDIGVALPVAFCCAFRILVSDTVATPTDFKNLECF